jgi:carbon-monoxide dehydrogenase iron sulfur subunit
MKVIGVHLDRCTGCRTCELYCATERGSEEKSLLKAAQASPKPQARLRVEGGGGVSFPLQCRHCLDAPCLDACLAGALIREEKTNLVVIREDRCIACWTCTAFCPYGVIFPWPERKIALKCDRCAYMEEPICVDVCPTRALELVDPEAIDDLLRTERKGILRDLAAHRRKGVWMLELGR